MLNTLTPGDSYIYTVKLAIIDSGYGITQVRHQSITWIDAAR